MSRIEKKKSVSGRLIVAVVLIIIVVGWTIPTLGVFVTSFRDSRDIYGSGWWTVLPHKALARIRTIELPADTDPNAPVTIEGHEATFEEWRAGVTLEDGSTFRWIGNKRSRTVDVYKEKWIGFGANLTLKNYKDVLSGGAVDFTDAQGNVISRQGSNFADAVLNSLAVSIPATVIPILIAAFAAYAFSWMEFPGRRPLFIMVVALLVVPLQIALIPILRDFTKWGLNGTFVGIRAI